MITDPQEIAKRFRGYLSREARRDRLIVEHTDLGKISRRDATDLQDDLGTDTVVRFNGKMMVPYIEDDGHRVGYDAMEFFDLDAALDGDIRRRGWDADTRDEQAAFLASNPEILDEPDVDPMVEHDRRMIREWNPDREVEGNSHLADPLDGEDDSEVRDPRC